MSDNHIIVISGPSGSGKSTLINRLRKEHPEITFSTSHTTRAMREQEQDGIHYHFVSKEHFQEMISGNEFVEWADVYGNYYGTSFKAIESGLKSGKTIILDIDVQGAARIKESYPDALFIFLVPPSMKVLEQRLLAREKGPGPHISRRLAVARQEFEQYYRYDYIIINDNLENAFQVLNAIYIARQNTWKNHEAFIKNVLLAPAESGHTQT